MTARQRATSPYLMQPRKPRPAWLPGDMVATEDGIYICRHTRWDGERWVYVVVEPGRADAATVAAWLRGLRRAAAEVAP